MSITIEPTRVLSLPQVEHCIENRPWALNELDIADAEERLIDYVPLVWQHVEPVRPFVRSWVIEGILEHLEAVHRGEIKKLLINVPPGFMKSLATDVFFPTWEWGPRNKPHYRYICASYSQDLTIRDNLRSRLIMESPEYQAAWGDRFHLLGDQNAKEKFVNNKTGFKLATSVRGVGTGERGDRIIIDDPHNVLQGESDARRAEVLQWFTEVLPTRRIDPAMTAFIVIMQRVHELDCSGHILAKELGYTHFCVPMHFDPDHPHIDKRRMWVGWRGDPRTKLDQLAFPERFNKEAVDEMSKDMMSWGGTYAVAGQLEQRPEPRGGGMIKIAWFEIVDAVPPGAHVRCRGWDFAGTDEEDADSQAAETASCRVCEVWQDDGTTELYVEDATTGLLSPGELYEFIKITVEVDGYDVFQSLPQDPGQAGKYQIADMLDLFRGYDHEFSPESGDKVVRFRPIAAQAETRAKAGRKIKLVRGDWNARFLNDVSKFPRGRKKDIPDALSRGYGGITRRGGGMFLIGGSTLVTPDPSDRPEA